MALEALLTDSAGATVLDLSDLCQSKSVTPRLNLPGTASCRLPSEFLPADLEDADYRLKLRLDGTIAHNGLVWAGNDDGDEDTAYSTLTSIDPTVLLTDRPARDDDGDFSKPSFIDTFGTGPQIMQQIVANSVTYEGPLPFTVGAVATGGVDLSGAPVDWPMMIQQIQTLLVNTGELDCVFTPVDGGANMGTLDLWNGDYGVDRTGSAIFDWGTGSNNVRRVQKAWTKQHICNKLWYYLGPRKLSSTDPAGDQHWAGSITGDGYPDGGGPPAAALPNPPGGDVGFPNPLGDLILDSRAAHHVRMNIRIFDGDESSTAVLYARLWQTEQLLRANARRMIKITPIRGLRPSFGIGDLITLNAGAKLRGGYTNAVQRVYAYTVSEDEDGVVSVDGIVASPDQETL